MRKYLFLVALFFIAPGFTLSPTVKQSPDQDMFLFVAPPEQNGVCSPMGYWGIVGGPVTTCGNDATADGSKGLPFATPQGAVDFLMEKIDLLGKYRATIQLAVGNVGSQLFYPGVAISGRIAGQGGSLPPLFVGVGQADFPIGKYRPLTIQGDPANFTGVWISPGTVGTRVFPDSIGVSLTDGAAVKLLGLSVDTSTAKQDCIDVFNYSVIELNTVAWGNCGAILEGVQRIGLGLGWNGSAGAIVTGPLHVYGSMAAWIQSGGWIYGNNNGPAGNTINVTFHNTPSMLWAALYIDGGYTYVANWNFIGSINAPRSAWILTNGTLETNTGPQNKVCPNPCVIGNPNYLPHTVATGTGVVLVEDNGVYR
jgi:hypothetical protein